MSEERRWLRVGRSEELGTGLVRRTYFGRHVGLFRDAEGVLRAIEVTCRHQNADLTQGERCGDRVTCPRHGWVYDLRSGACLTESWARLRRYAVREEAGVAWLDPTPLAEESVDEEGAALARQE